MEKIHRIMNKSLSPSLPLSLSFSFTMHENRQEQLLSYPLNEGQILPHINTTHYWCLPQNVNFFYFILHRMLPQVRPPPPDGSSSCLHCHPSDNINYCYYYKRSASSCRLRDRTDLDAGWGFLLPTRRGRCRFFEPRHSGVRISASSPDQHSHSLTYRPSWSAGLRWRRETGTDGRTRLFD